MLASRPMPSAARLSRSCPITGTMLSTGQPKTLKRIVIHNAPASRGLSRAARNPAASVAMKEMRAASRVTGRSRRRIAERSPAV